MDFVHDLLDEIALEGLDGITIEALWTRLNHRQRNKQFSLALDEDGKAFLWQRIALLPDLSFYELPRFEMINWSADCDWMLLTRFAAYHLIVSIV